MREDSTILVTHSTSAQHVVVQTLQLVLSHPAVKPRKAKDEPGQPSTSKPKYLASTFLLPNACQCLLLCSTPWENTIQHCKKSVLQWTRVAAKLYKINISSSSVIVSTVNLKQRPRHLWAGQGRPQPQPGQGQQCWGLPAHCGGLLQGLPGVECPVRWRRWAQQAAPWAS